MVNTSRKVVSKFYPETSHLRQGRIVWPTVHRKEKSSYGKSIRHTELTQVIIDLIGAEDMELQKN